MSSTATTQIITLLGVALGAGAGYVSTSLVERSRARRESDARWDARRFDALSDSSSARYRWDVWLVKYQLHVAGRGQVTQ